MSAINGNNVRLKLVEHGSTAGKSIAGCDRSVTINLSTETVEVTSPTAYFTEFLPTYDSASISLDNLLVINPTGSELPSATLLQWKQDHQLLDFQLLYEDGASNSEIVGSCYITTASITGAVDSVAEMTVEFIVTGRYDFYS